MGLYREGDMRAQIDDSHTRGNGVANTIAVGSSSYAFKPQAGGARRRYPLLCGSGGFCRWAGT